MNGFVAVNTMKKLEKEYRKCPYCKNENDIEIKNEKFYISCKCGFYLVTDEKGKMTSRGYRNNENNCSCFK